MPYNEIEISVRYRGRKKSAPIINNTETAATVIREIYSSNTLLWREEAIILCLNSANRLLGWNRVAIGGINNVYIDSKIIGTIALNCIATGIILAHNHPSGDPNPSLHDVHTTLQVQNVMDIIGIKLLDHIILTEDTHFSMKEHAIF